MKNRPFFQRLRFALNGIKLAWRAESSFRVQLLCAAGALALLFALRPDPIWWAAFFLTIGGVLAMELINTALESALDRIHPEKHPLIGKAKDCAAAAVLVLSLSALGVAAALLWSYFFR